MWDAAKQEEFDELRHREQESALTDEERQTLEKLLYELDKEEWRALGPGLERLRQEWVQLQQQCSSARTQNTLLAALAERQAGLMARAKNQLSILFDETGHLE